MRFRLNFIVMSFLLALGAIDAHAQYPERGLTLIVPYGEGQIVYRRSGELEHEGSGDGPTEAEFWFIEATDDIGNAADD